MFLKNVPVPLSGSNVLDEITSFFLPKLLKHCASARIHTDNER